MTEEKHVHVYGVSADFDGVCHYAFSKEETENFYIVDIFNFCPECGEKLF